MSKDNHIVSDSTPLGLRDHPLSGGWVQFRSAGCREITLRNWTLRRPSQEYWRLYWNPSSGAQIRREGALYELTPERVMLIPPRTHYTSRLKADRVRHFFVHFQLGKPYDSIQPGLLDFEVTQQIRSLIERLRRWANRPAEPVSLLALGELVFHLLGKLDAGRWPQRSGDDRIEQALSVGLADLSLRKSNEELARAAHMSTNAFIRRFKQLLGQAPQTYLTHRRIEQARHLLAQTDATIEQIAESCGFAGRSHFSTVFARETGMGPAGYRKRAQP